MNRIDECSPGPTSKQQPSGSGLRTALTLDLIAMGFYSTISTRDGKKGNHSVTLKYR